MFFLFSACSKENKYPSIIPILTNLGVNSLDSKTPFELNIVTPKLIGYSVDMFSTIENGLSKSVMRVHYYGQEVMIIIPTDEDNNAHQYIKEISITSDFVENPFKIKMGTKYNKSDFSTCQELQEGLVCKQNNLNNIKLIFKKDTHKVWSLQEIIWSANA